MALIGKIREKSWLLVIVVGVAMLAFIIGDFNKSSGQQEDVYGIGTVNGEKMDEPKYENYLNNARNNIFQSKQMQNPGQQATFTRQDEMNARNQAWRTSVVEKLMDNEYKKLGLIVDEFELDNILYGENGYTPSSLSAQFTDSVTGQFAPEELRKALNSLQESNDPNQVKQYQSILDYVRQVRLEEKYTTLLTSGVHTTSLEAKKEYYNTKTVKNVSYVYQAFARIPDGAIGDPTEEEMLAYFNKHKEEGIYKQKASRKIAYFSMYVFPSDADTANAVEFLNKLAPKFKETNKDSAFVLKYSDEKVFASDSTAMARPENSGVPYGNIYPLTIASQMENAKVGDLVGPYISNKGAILSKVLKFIPEKTATVRHILLTAQTPEAVETAQKKADSIIKVIKTKHNFEEMVTEFSQDPGSVSNGGKYEKFTQGMMVPEFNDFSFQKPIGTLGSVKTSYGIHIIEVLGREETNRPVIASIVKSIVPSKITVDNTNSIASSIIFQLDDLFKNKNAEEHAQLFDSIAKLNASSVRFEIIRDDNPQLAGGFSEIAEGKFLRLAYEEGVKEGNISSSPIRDHEQIMVAYVASVITEGVPTFDLVKDQINTQVRKEKQAQYLIDNMVAFGKDLKKMAESLGVDIISEGVTFSARNLQVGSEPELVGVIFSGLADGETSIPVKGQNGVFVVRIDATADAPATEDYSAEKEQLKSQDASNLRNQFQNALIEGAQVVDNRNLRKYGIR
ncbi:MAG: peptidylprolyl isomerase [Brumimicrobium sp.]|nr:peptidylprolyl isomerase [Brumimicrobium sp.]